MSSPQDAPVRKKQKARARRRLEAWRKKREAEKPAEASAAK
jgi:hypothetical protein